MTLFETFEEYNSIRKTGGGYPMTVEGDAAWDARLGELERAIESSEPRCLTEILAAIATVEKILRTSDDPAPRAMLADVLENCRQALVDVRLS